MAIPLLGAVLRIPATPALMAAAGKGLVAVNLELLRQAKASGRPLPDLRLSGVRYRQEPYGREEWDNVLTLLRRGWGDCEDLAAWRAAEVQLQGGKAELAVRPSRSGIPGRYHAVVWRPDLKKFEDPSEWQGMAGPRAD